MLDKSIFGERDEYGLSYWTDAYGFHLGDRLYALSPLTENFRYGRGAAASVNAGGFETKAYYMKTRWLEPDEEQIGAQLGLRIRPGQQVGVNYLRKQAAGGQSDMVSLESRLTPWRGTTVELEAAAGESDGGKRDPALRAEVHGDYRWVAFHLNAIRAEPDYPGYYSDREFLSANLVFPFTQRLSLNTTFRQERRTSNSCPIATPRSSSATTSWASTTVSCGTPPSPCSCSSASARTASRRPNTSFARTRCAWGPTSASTTWACPRRPSSARARTGWSTTPRT